MALSSQSGFHIFLFSSLVVVTERENLFSRYSSPLLCPLWFDTVTCGQEEVSIFDIDGHGERASFGHMIEMYMYIHCNDIECRTNTIACRHTPTFDTK